MGLPMRLRIQAFPVLWFGWTVLTGFIEVVEDITDRKRKQDALKRANFCVEQAADCILWIDPEGKIVFANQKACEVLEYSKEELQAMTVFDIDPMITREWWRPHWEAIREKKSFVIETLPSHEVRPDFSGGDRRQLHDLRGERIQLCVCPRHQ